MAPQKATHLGEMPVEFLMCRAGRHPFSPIMTLVVQVKRRKAYDTTWTCERCGTRKHEVWSAVNGQLIQRDPYEYPDGYLLEPQALDGVSRRQLNGETRIELFERIARPARKAG